MRSLLALTVSMALAGTAGLTACGSDTVTRPAGGEGDVPITQAAIAAVALDHLPGPPSSMQATYTDRSDPAGLLGADLRYHRTGEDDGDLVRVTLEPPASGRFCREPQGCELLDSPPGTKLYLIWGRETPEEDPGYVDVVLRRPHEDISAMTAGTAITRDPRTMELDVSVGTLTALVLDDRLHLMATQEVVDAGERLDGWGGQEPDPHAYDRVPSTDEAITAAYFLGHGGFLSYSGPTTSPLKDDLGPGVIGGRFRHAGDGDRPDQVVDVLAAPGRPSWLAEDPCATPRFVGHCQAFRGRRGPKYLAWVPGPDSGGGEVWMFQLRPREVVAVRTAGFDVPESQDDVEVASEWFLLRGFLDNRNLGLTCDREVLDFHLAEAQAEGG